MDDDKKIEEQKESFFEELIDLIKGNTVIPIIGYDLLNSATIGNVAENPTLDVKLAEDPTKDLLTKLLETYDKDLCAEVIAKKKSKNIEIKSGYDLLNAVYHELDVSRKRIFLVRLRDKIDSVRNYVEAVPIPFQLLAKIKRFQFYINATIFNHIEYAVNVYKAPERRKDNPDDETDENSTYDVLNCKASSLEDIKILNYDKDAHLANPRKFSTTFFKKPCILNLFGTYNISSRDYVILDTDVIELITDLFKSKQKYDDLKFILKYADLLFIGCDFPDWLLRFFIRFCADSPLVKEKLSSSYIFEKLNSKQEFSKTFFITNYGMNMFEMDPGDFVKELYRRLNEDNERNENIEKDYYNNSIFISYNHEDKAIADKIVEQLRGRFIDVWYDREGGLRQGDALDVKIKNAIDNSCAFIPIISSRVNTNIDEEKYYKKEWNYAVQNKKEGQIFPIRTTDFTNHGLYSAGAFSQETINLLLMNSGYIYETVDSLDAKFNGEKFLIMLKDLQYKSRTQSQKRKYD